MKKTVLIMMSALALNTACSADEKSEEKESPKDETVANIESTESPAANIQMSAYANGDIEIWNESGEGSVSLTLHIAKGELRWEKAITVSGSDKTSVSWIKDFEVEGPISESESGIAMMNLYVDNEAGEMVASVDAYMSRPGYFRLINEAYDYQDFGPPTLKGKLKNSVYWNDRAGHHFVVKSQEEDEPGIYLNYFLLGTDGHMDLKDWKEHEIECEFDVMDQHVVKDALEDADGDGLKEYYSLLISDCKSDVSPSKGYLYIMEGDDIYTLECSDKAEGESLAQTADDALKANPKILAKAKEVWENIAPNVGF